MKRVLVIDDSETDRLTYRRYLGVALGHERLEISEASTAEEGLLKFATLRPDCVLLDYNLPGTDGLEVLHSLQQRMPADTLCVVMITGGGNEKLAVRALNSGALDYLVKGQFDQDLLCKTVFHAIEKNEWRQYQSRYHRELHSVNQQLRESLQQLTETRQQVSEKNAQLQAANQEIETRNRALARSNADLDNFVYAASHDLRQPVDNLRGLFEELRRSATFADPADEPILQMVDNSLASLSSTINDLATLVQTDNLPGRHPAEEVDVATVVAEVQQALRPQVEATAARISTDLSALPVVHYVRTNLRTILLNLVSNALKYRQPGRPPRVLIRTRLLEGQPVVEVQDNGLGLDLERHGNELFQLFRRFHADADKGTGVGLFLVNRIVQAHGGRIELESTVGEGSLFQVYLARQ